MSIKKSAVILSKIHRRNLLIAINWPDPLFRIVFFRRCKILLQAILDVLQHHKRTSKMEMRVTKIIQHFRLYCVIYHIMVRLLLCKIYLVKYLKLVCFDQKSASHKEHLCRLDVVAFFLFGFCSCPCDTQRYFINLTLSDVSHCVWTTNLTQFPFYPSSWWGVCTNFDGIRSNITLSITRFTYTPIESYNFRLLHYFEFYPKIKLWLYYGFFLYCAHIMERK